MRCGPGRGEDKLIWGWEDQLIRGWEEEEERVSLVEAAAMCPAAASPRCTPV